ncbi:MAG: metal ABC transporter solute-binding protein, Zn/Mn family [Sphaerochaeta sp.]|jgi:hypothetical protein|uniref:metal ABC transporter solute-binding protein, Zn/Mn family n=1 Tax=Sphaerochaeta sp. TaxID=1972642 RepID=UPI002FC6752B
MKKFSVLVLLVLSSVALYAQPIAETHPSVVASTSWTAAFADLGGLDGVRSIAPANLVHPPEYEITVNDVVAINKADYFLYAGYERMMQSMGSSIKKDAASLIKIETDNSIANVTKQAEYIASLLGTEVQSKQRVDSYRAVIEQGKALVHQAGLDQLPVYCHAMQMYLAKDLGLQVAGTFGPGPISAKQIAEAAKGGYAIIIDNFHNPIASVLLSVSPKSKLVVWRNFPDREGRGSLEAMVKQNIDALLQ